ncbi:hypothetical protein ACP70R_003585 [Stipagrostis hirtigluma subsp. patula]
MEHAAGRLPIHQACPRPRPSRSLLRLDAFWIPSRPSIPISSSSSPLPFGTAPRRGPRLRRPRGAPRLPRPATSLVSATAPSITVLALRVLSLIGALPGAALALLRRLRELDLSGEEGGESAGLNPEPSSHGRLACLRAVVHASWHANNASSAGQAGRRAHHAVRRAIEGHSLVTAMLLMLHYKKPLTKLKGVLGAGRLDLVVFAISSDS